jgi:hypothetical protein
MKTTKFWFKTWLLAPFETKLKLSPFTFRAKTLSKFNGLFESVIAVTFQSVFHLEMY